MIALLTRVERFLQGEGLCVFGRLLGGRLEPMMDLQRLARKLQRSGTETGDEEAEPLRDGHDMLHSTASIGAVSDNTTPARGLLTVSRAQYVAAVAANTAALKALDSPDVPVRGFTKVHCCDGFADGVRALAVPQEGSVPTCDEFVQVQDMLSLCGLGRMAPNTVVMGFQKLPENRKPGDIPSIPRVSRPLCTRDIHYLTRQEVPVPGRMRMSAPFATR